MAPATDLEATAVPIDTALWAGAFPAMAAAIQRIGASGRHDRYTTTTLPAWSAGLMDQYRHRYEPSRRLLEAALSPLVD